MRVYRLEDHEGTGPYYNDHMSSFDVYDVCNINPSKVHPEWPMPNRDGIFDFNEDYKFGFADMQAFQSWFPVHENEELLELLQEFEYIVGIYKVPDENVMHGRKQVAFDTTVAVRVATLPLEYI